MRQMEARQKKKDDRARQRKKQLDKYLKEANAGRDLDGTGPDDDASANDNTETYNANEEWKGDDVKAKLSLPAQWVHLNQEPSMKLHEKDSTSTKDKNITIEDFGPLSDQKVPLCSEVGSYIHGMDIQEVTIKGVTTSRAFIPLNTMLKFPRILTKTGVARDVAKWVSLRSQKDGDGNENPKYSRVFHKMTNMRIGYLPDTWVPKAAVSTDTAAKQKSEKIYGGTFVAFKMSESATFDPQEWFCMEPNCGDNCNCIVINSAIMYGACQKNSHPSAKFDAIEPQLRFLDELEKASHDTTFEQMQDGLPFWQCSNDLELCILFNRCFIKCLHKGCFGTKYFLRGIDNQGTLKDNSLGVCGGLVPLCETGICFLINRRANNTPGKGARNIGTGLKLLRCVAAPIMPGAYQLATIGRQDGSHSYGNYMKTHGSYSSYTEKIFRLIIEAIVNDNMKKRVMIGDVPSLPSITNEWLFHLYSEGAVMRETLEAPLTKGNLESLVYGLRHLFGVHKDNDSKFCLADHRMRYHLLFTANATNIVLKMKDIESFQAVHGTNGTFHDAVHWKVDDDTGKPESPTHTVKHCMNLCVHKLAASELSQLIDSQVPTVPNSDGKTKVFGVEMKQFAPSVPNWYVAKFESAGWTTDDDGFSKIGSWKDTTNPGDELKDAMDTLRDSLQEECLKMSGLTGKTTDFKWQMEVSILQGRLDTNVSVWTAPHSCMSRTSQAEIAKVGGFTAFARFPLGLHGAFFRIYESQSDSRGHLIYCSHGSVVIGPMSSIQDFGQISHIEGNRQAFVSIVAIPTAACGDFPNDFMSLSCKRTYPHLDRSLKGCSETEAVSMHDADGGLTDKIEKDLCVTWVRNYKQQNSIGKNRTKGDKIAGKAIKQRMSLFQTKDYKNFHLTFR